MTTIIEERLILEGDGKRVQAILAYPDSGEPSAGVLLLGAHPLLGGNAGNNVISALRVGLAEAGAAVLSFDYLAVDTRRNTAAWADMLARFWRDHRVDEETRWADQAAIALAYLQRAVPTGLVLVGYSFGCQVASRLARDPSIRGVVLISPNPSVHDLSGITDSSAPCLVVHSDNDFACPAWELESWWATRRKPGQRFLLTGAEHFFRGREQEVLDRVVQFLSSFERVGDLP